MRIVPVIAAAAAALVTACFSAGEYHCATDTECVNLVGASGFCEGNGLCSFADSSCDSGRRYGPDGNGALGGQCTTSNGDASVDDASVADAPTDGGTPDACVPLPGGEICNGLDDDCDMAIDDGFALGFPCDGADSDLCQEGVTVCDLTGTGTMCDDTTGDNVELCNGIDDNCNLLTDEGYGVGAMCDGPDTDACLEGVLVCNLAGTGTDCTDMTTSTIETCNGLDDDCQLGIDDPWPLKGTACTVGIGACQRTGLWICNLAGTGLNCSVMPGAPAPEFCGDGIDSDCSGGTDPVCPTNDLRAGAVNVSAGGTFMADVTYAHDDAVGSCGAAGGRDVFYQFTLPAAEVVYADTLGSGFDTVLKVESGACTAAAAQTACVNDSCAGAQSQYAAQLAAGTYCLVVDQASGAVTTGSVVLRFVRGGRTGAQVPLGASTQTGTTVGATNVTNGGCNTSNAGDVGYWFTTCPGVRMVSANTCSSSPTWDSMLYFRAGAASSADVACDDDGCVPTTLLSRITNASITGPNLFWVVVDGYSTSTGAYTLQLAL